MLTHKSLFEFVKKGITVVLTCTISGSFRRFLPQISATMKECAEQKVTVLSPISIEPTGEKEGFIFLKGDWGETKEIESSHLRAIRKSDFLYVVNPGGYIGPSTTIEVGYALALSIPIFSLEPATESVLAMFMQNEHSIEKVRRTLEDSTTVKIPRGADLATLQTYMRKVVHLRGFDDESIRDVMLLLVEEIGELAKAIRREIGLKVGPTNPEDRKMVAHEIADCLIYLLDLANLANIDLDDAFRAKEEVNNRKIWIRDNPSE